MEFIYDLKSPVQITNKIRSFSFYSKISVIQRKALVKYINNLLLASYFGKSLTYSRNGSIKTTNSVKLSILLKCEKVLLDNGMILVSVDNVSPLSSRKRCKITLCNGLDDMLPYVQGLISLNLGLLIKAMGDSFREEFGVDYDVQLKMSLKEDGKLIEENITG